MEARMTAAITRAQSTSHTTQQMIHLYDLDEVARFVHAVAYAEVTAASIGIVHHSWMDGGDQVEFTRDQQAMREMANNIAANLMRRFSVLCKSGSKAAVDGFLQHLRLQYIAGRQYVDSVFAQFQNSNQQLQRNLEIGADIAHIVHGAANIAFTALSFAVPAGKVAGAARTALGMAKGINLADGMISAVSDRSVIGGIKKAVADPVMEKVAEDYSKKATATMVNIATRTWKYQGALQNAEIRLVKQSGIAVGASVFLAFGDVKEIGEAVENLAHSNVASQQQPPRSVPDIQVPSARN